MIIDEDDEYCGRRTIPEDKRFTDLYEDLDSCPECGEAPLVFRKKGYVCPHCRIVVIPNEHF